MLRSPEKSVLALAVLALLAACGPSQPQLLVIGHRGASGYMPEHTLESYTKAIELGADFIEPDLVSTKDGVLVARHEPNIIATTDVLNHPEFASRRKTVVVDGQSQDGFFVSDFTLAELKTLRAKQQFPERDQTNNGKFEVPTFDEILQLAQSKGKTVGRTIGVYPETKHSIYHEELGLPLEEKLLASLKAVGWDSADAPVFIQSFEQANLKALHEKTKVRLIQLVDAGGVDPVTGAITYGTPNSRPYDWTKAGRTETYRELLTPAGLDDVKTYAYGVGPWKRYIVTVKATKLTAEGTPADLNGDGKVNDADFDTVADGTLIQEAHKRGLKVHSWTFRNESFRLAGSYINDPIREYAQFFALGLDGVFSDFPDTAVTARDVFETRKSQ